MERAETLFTPEAATIWSEIYWCW